MRNSLRENWSLTFNGKFVKLKIRIIKFIGTDMHVSQTKLLDGHKFLKVNNLLGKIAKGLTPLKPFSWPPRTGTTSLKN